MASPIPGTLHLTPPPLLATGVLLLNDHVLKRLIPSVVSGKLSDAAGVFNVATLRVARSPTPWPRPGLVHL